MNTAPRPERPLPPHVVRSQAETCLGIVQHLRETVAAGQPVDRTLGRLYRARREFGSRDRRFFSQLAFSYFRWRGWLVAAEQPADAAECAMAYCLDADAPHPAIDFLAGQGSSIRPIGGLDLTGKASAVAEWTGRESPPLPEQLVPAWVPTSLYTPDGSTAEDHRRLCIQAFQARPPTWLRLDSGREREAEARLERAGIPHTPHPRIRSAISIPHGYSLDSVLTPAPSAHLQRLERSPDLSESRGGQVGEIQDLASQCVGLLAAPAKDETWWDVCAGSGGKSLHLAELLNGAGRIFATDSRPSILDQFRKRLKRSFSNPEFRRLFAFFPRSTH